ncbi:fumarylacetoacetate hydrolase family protein [Candidatus Omnitrophota bacterium]
MRILRFQYKSDKPAWGKLQGETVRVLSAPPFGRISLSKKSFPLAKVKLLAPVVPSKVILVGLNYKDHARELKMRIPREPVLFLKPPTALIGHGQPIVYPQGVKRLDYEAELALVIKKRAHAIALAKAKDYILGYTCLNDVTARDLQKKDGQWTRAKSFDTFCPIGPWIETRLDPARQRVSSYLNGRQKQDASTADLIFKAGFLVSFISRVMTLEPGDVISTGTPAGVGPMKVGDTIKVRVDGIGCISNKVVRGLPAGRQVARSRNG